MTAQSKTPRLLRMLDFFGSSVCYGSWLDERPRLDEGYKLIRGDVVLQVNVSASFWHQNLINQAVLGYEKKNFDEYSTSRH